MDIYSLGSEAPIPVFAIIFWGLAVVAIIAPLAFRWSEPGIGTISAVIAISLALCGVIMHAGAHTASQNKAFSDQLASDYNLTTESTVYDVERAAKEGRTVTMSDESGPIEVRPRFDGKMLTFYKLGEGELITPRS